MSEVGTTTAASHQLHTHNTAVDALAQQTEEGATSDLSGSVRRVLATQSESKTTRHTAQSRPTTRQHSTVRKQHHKTHGSITANNTSTQS